MTEVCQSCLYWRRGQRDRKFPFDWSDHITTDNGDERIALKGACRYQPPSISGSGYGGIFPVTFEDDWCGFWSVSA